MSGQSGPLSPARLKKRLKKAPGAIRAVTFIVMMTISKTTIGHPTKDIVLKKPTMKNAAANAAVRIADQNPSARALINELSLPCPFSHVFQGCLRRLLWAELDSIWTDRRAFALS
jgi:hypothetical protein